MWGRLYIRETGLGRGLEVNQKFNDVDEHGGRKCMIIDSVTPNDTVADRHGCFDAD